jgi:uncharacterized membrane protein (UPF0127 family)
MRAVNYARNQVQVLIEQGTIAADRWSRLRGLLGYPVLRSGEGLWLPGTQCIHTFGMRFPIDVLFLDVCGCVIHSIHALQPWRISPYIHNATSVLELPAGILRQTGTKLGDPILVILGKTD